MKQLEDYVQLHTRRSVSDGCFRRVDMKLVGDAYAGCCTCSAHLSNRLSQFLRGPPELLCAGALI
jgi:hypothetical protein